MEEQWDVKGLAGELSLHTFEKHIFLRVLDDKWKEHLSTMGHLRQGIHLRGYAAKKTKQEYKREAFELYLPQVNRSAETDDAIQASLLCERVDKGLFIL